MLRRDGIPAIESEFDIVLALVPAHVVNDLIEVLHRGLGRVRIRPYIDSEIFFRSDVWESIQTRKLDSGIDEELCKPVVAEPRLAGHRRRIRVVQSACRQPVTLR